MIYFLFISRKISPSVLENPHCRIPIEIHTCNTHIPSEFVRKFNWTITSKFASSISISYIFNSYWDITRDIREKKRKDSTASLSFFPSFYSWAWYIQPSLSPLFFLSSLFSLLFSVCPRELASHLDRSRLNSRIANFNLRTRARNSVTFVTVSRNVPLCVFAWIRLIRLEYRRELI